MTGKNFDPFKKFQIKDEFPPNKECSWGHPMERDGMVHAHNSIRKEIRLLAESFEVVCARRSSKDWEIKSIISAWKCHYEHIHAHHKNEDDLLTPFLETRFKYPEKYSDDHTILVETLEKLNKKICELKEGDSVEKLTKEVAAYEKAMIPHLKEEEIEALPLLRAFFTPQELSPKIKEIIDEGPKIEMGSFITCMGSERFRNEFMPQEGIPFFVWHIDFRYRVALFEEKFLNPITALKSGDEPKQTAVSFFSYRNMLVAAFSIFSALVADYYISGEVASII